MFGVWGMIEMCQRPIVAFQEAPQFFRRGRYRHRSPCAGEVTWCALSKGSMRSRGLVIQTVQFVDHAGLIAEVQVLLQLD